MLPRTESIFHLGEEEGGEAPESAAAITELDCPKYEGLRILLIQRSARRSDYVVIKSLLKPCTPMASPPRFGFLRACCFCKRELSLHKDVYMYKGEQGFCSEDCRRRQILQDERSELEASTRERSKPPLPHHASTGVDDSGRRRRISAVA
ncbi:hypothetical protein OPV22_026538 [Ensete ventricosum]|uniref:FLZ-type domain-containing protein n=1 Tax=Ensete ventricosum TaxID=4639 RepID=A0AAV8QCY6_ENSVE|nr:hypothetical protein OPV22_026538 [Ensete ventricosum]